MFNPVYKQVKPECLDAVQRYWEAWGYARTQKQYSRLSATYLYETGRITEQEHSEMQQFGGVLDFNGALAHQKIQDQARDARLEDGDLSLWSTFWNERGCITDEEWEAFWNDRKANRVQ